MSHNHFKPPFSITSTYILTLLLIYYKKYIFTVPVRVPPKQVHDEVRRIMQASDVTHTMQHWHVYRKWNHKLLKECNVFVASSDECLNFALHKRQEWKTRGE
jgi:hypothetical protein